MAVSQSIKSLITLMRWILWLYMIAGSYDCSYLRLAVLIWPFFMPDQDVKRAWMAVKLLLRLVVSIIWLCVLTGTTDLGCSYVRIAVLASPLLMHEGIVKTAKRVVRNAGSSFHWVLERQQVAVKKAPAILLWIIWAYLLFGRADLGCSYIRISLLTVPFVFCEGVNNTAQLVKLMWPTLLVQLCECSLLILMSIVQSVTAWISWVFCPGNSRLEPPIVGGISIDDFLDDGHPTTRFHDTYHFRVCTMGGQRLWQGFIDILLNAYENGRSWAGNFDDEHLQVSGGEFIIDTEPNELASYANLLLDLARLANLLIRHFVTANQLPPRYIQALYRSLTEPLLQAVPVPSPEEIQNFLKFMRNHPALKPARRTNTFVNKVFQASRAMGPVERGTFMAAVANVQVPLDWFQGILALGYILLNRTLRFKIGDPNNILCVYRNGPAQVFRFIRNLLEHGSDADHGTGQQMIDDMEDVDYIIAEVFPGFITHLVWHIVMDCDMTGLFFKQCRVLQTIQERMGKQSKVPISGASLFGFFSIASSGKQPAVELLCVLLLALLAVWFA